MGKSVPLRDNAKPSELMLSDASIIIIGEDHFRDTLQQIDHGIYQTVHNHRPINGMTYEVQVNVNGFPMAMASSQAPSLESKLLEMEPISREDSATEKRLQTALQISRPAR